jgi:hypothetical protein
MEMKILVGYTGFVGSNLIGQTNFEHVFNSTTIEEAYGLNPDVLVYSGVPAEKFLANTQPEKDFAIIENAIENIKKINPKRVILISTVDVYPVPIDVDENTPIDNNIVQPYGKNRLYLENWVESNCSDYLIVRLPALFGKNIKKNFIYDAINIVPGMLNSKVYNELVSSYSWIEGNYTLQDNGFYKLIALEPGQKKDLKEKFLQIGFTALDFTDSRAAYQFYNLEHLWEDISTALEHRIKKINLATEPLTASEIYHAIFNKEFKNEVSSPVSSYNFTTVHSGVFGNSGNYIQDKDSVLKDINSFVKSRI